MSTPASSRVDFNTSFYFYFCCVSSTYVCSISKHTCLNNNITYTIGFSNVACISLMPPITKSILLFFHFSLCFIFYSLNKIRLKMSLLVYRYISYITLVQLPCYIRNYISHRCIVTHLYYIMKSFMD